MRMSHDVSKVLETNKRQKEFYNSTDKKKKNLPTRIWSFLRNGLLSDYRKNFDLKDRVYDEHIIWFGNLEDKKVLDLGCLRGNALSLYLAENAKQYIGIDLSNNAIDDYRRKLTMLIVRTQKQLPLTFSLQNSLKKILTLFMPMACYTISKILIYWLIN